MNNIKVKLPHSDIEIEQLPEGHAVTDAADYLQQTVIRNVDKPAVNCLELGSGNGIITLMLALQKPAWQLTGIEIQKELVDLAERNNARLGLSCRFRLGDLREFRSLLDYNGYDLVYSNPPWVKSGSGKVSPDFARAMSRQEVTCTLRDILACIEWSLAQQGAAFVIYPAERKAELSREVMRTELEVSNLFESDHFPGAFIAKLRRKAMTLKW
jgi:tRNA1Val (adenine37-N6)-methyltransferase